MSQAMSEKPALPPAQAFAAKDLVAYADGSVVSKTLVQNAAGTVTLFSFDAGQALSEHTAPFDALAHIVDGEAELTIGGAAVRAVEGQLVLMPADVPHAVLARAKFKMLLIMIREPRAHRPADVAELG